MGYPSDRFLTGVLQQRFIWQGNTFAMELTPEAQALYIGTTPFMIKAGGRILLTRSWTDDSLSLVASADHNFAPAALYSYMEGYSALGQLIAAHQFSKIRLEGNVSYAAERNLDYHSGALLLPLAYTGPSLGMAAKYADADIWSALFQYNYYFRSFATIEQPDDVQRIDHLLELTLRVDRRVSSRVTLFLTAYLLLNSSSLGDQTVENENYHAYRTLFGASWTFL